MNNIRGFNDLKRINEEDEADTNEYWENMMNKIGSSFAMGISFGTGALLSFYLLKHYLMNKTA